MPIDLLVSHDAKRAPAGVQKEEKDKKEEEEKEKGRRRVYSKQTQRTRRTLSRIGGGAGGRGGADALFKSNAVNEEKGKRHEDGAFTAASWSNKE